MSATIYDIARKAGVSVKTVSRVLNNEPYVAKATRERVQKVIEGERYQPRLDARNLRRPQHDCVGVVLSAPMELVPLSEQYLSWLFGQLYRLFGCRGYSVMFDFPAQQEHQEFEDADYSRGLTSRRFAALLVVGPIAVNDTILERMHASGWPYLIFSPSLSVPEASVAAVDYELGAYLSTKQLLERGHRRIAIITNFQGYFPDLLRRQGYQRALTEAGIAIDETLVRSVGFSSPQVLTAVHRLLLNLEVTALIDSSMVEDGAALREGARRAGRKIGKDVDILPWTYADGATVLRDACSHLWIPAREASAEGMEQLSQWLEGKRVKPIHLMYPPILYEAKDPQELTPRKRVFEIPEFTS